MLRKRAVFYDLRAIFYILKLIGCFDREGELVNKRFWVSFALLLLVSFPVEALSWAYPFVVWNGNVYEVKDERVTPSAIGKNIGEVETKPDEMTGEYYGNASNVYPEGTKYYEIKGVSTSEAIAVEIASKRWVRAVYVHDAPFHIMNGLTLPFAIAVAAAASVGVIFIVRRRRNSANCKT
jgi:hypothetical protein